MPFVFEPFFRSRQVAYELQRLQTVSEQRKFTIYFERYGCLVCETRRQSMRAMECAVTAATGFLQIDADHSGRN